MDLFEFIHTYGVLICKPCAFAVAPAHLRAHLLAKHREHAQVCEPGKWPGSGVRRLSESLLEKYSVLDPRHVTIEIPPPDSPPLPGLKLYCGIQCSRCPLIYCSRKGREKMMQQHFNSHRAVPRRRGAQHKVPKDPSEEDAGPLWQEVHCQRYFAAGPQSSFFRVTLPSELQSTAACQKGFSSLRKDELLRAIIDRELDQSGRNLELAARVYRNQATKTEVSPWLEMTRWPCYFDGLDFTEVAPLGYMPNPATEPLLQLLTESLDRIVEKAHASICEDRIGVFDQAKINSFIVGSSKNSERMLMVKLQKQTFREYKSLWKRLLCFAYRTSQPNQQMRLPHQFTTSQLFYLDRTTSYTRKLLALDAAGDLQPKKEKAKKEAEVNLDRDCLLLCISLLDHNLRGSHFESVVLGFLAVLGIDQKEGGVFLGPCAYSPYLSKFIKIAQMLVVQRAVLAVEEGDVEYPSDMLDDMRDRFLVRGSRSAFDWACRLRAYAKKVLNSTTSLGYIGWSEDKETVTYKDVNLQMTEFRDFVAVQVQPAQKQLEELLLLHPDECRENVVPTFQLHRLQDDHSNNRKGWNFLKDTRNLQHLKGGGERWLLDRVLENDWLSGELLDLTKENQIRWKKDAVKRYFSKVDGFLERLLLLVHLTSGQPARGTELVSLRHINTAQGHHRSIFIEDGLVGTVTSYHKGYNITGSTKIIHRYLPREVSELLVYYLCLVLPFWQELDVLVYQRKDPLSPFLWAKGMGSWDSTRLSAVIRREAEVYLKTRLNIMVYRHIAIAISRQHLKCGGFKRDYGLDKRLADEQATHGSWMAGTVYARGLEEAPGHVMARRAEYRVVSREWHTFLGFRVFLGPRKRLLGLEVLEEEEEPLKRRRMEDY